MWDLRNLKEEISKTKINGIVWRLILKGNLMIVGASSAKKFYILEYDGKEGCI